MVVPYLASNSLSDWQTWAEQMNVEAAAAKRYGIAYGYHNHAHEFTTDLGDGVTPWDILTTELDPGLGHLEIDIYWAVTGGPVQRRCRRLRDRHHQVGPAAGATPTCVACAADVRV